jgi:hypothetical protein
VTSVATKCRIYEELLVPNDLVAVKYKPHGTVEMGYLASTMTLFNQSK